MQDLIFQPFDATLHFYTCKESMKDSIYQSKSCLCIIQHFISLMPIWLLFESHPGFVSNANILGLKKKQKNKPLSSPRFTCSCGSFWRAVVLQVWSHRCSPSWGSDSRKMVCSETPGNQKSLTDEPITKFTVCKLDAVLKFLERRWLSTKNVTESQRGLYLSKAL